jgi:hypothetical protein
MNKAYALAVLTAVLSGCSLSAAAGKRQIEWPGEASTQLIVPLTEAGAAIAAAAAIREMVRQNPYPDLFWGCSSPEQGLDVVVFKDSSSGLYYVSVAQRFNRCGGPRVRVLDGYYEYAVTPQGEVVAEVLLPDEAPVRPASPGPTPAEQTPPPAKQPQGADPSAPTPAPTPPSVPAVPPPAAPCPASPPPTPPAPATSAATNTPASSTQPPHQATSPERPPMQAPPASPRSSTSPAPASDR